MKKIPSIKNLLGVATHEILNKLAAESSMGTDPDMKESLGLMQVTDKALNQIKTGTDKTSREIRQDILKAYPNFKYNRKDPLENIILGASYIRYCTRKLQERIDNLDTTPENINDLINLSYWIGPFTNANMVIEEIKKDPVHWRERLDELDFVGIPKPAPGSYERYLRNHDYSRFFKL